MSNFVYDDTTHHPASPEDTQIKLIATECMANALDHGFELGDKNPQLVAMAEEIGEWCGAVRQGNIPNELEEIVDILIRALAYAEFHFANDWHKAMIQKMKYNRGRPFKHGKMF